MHELIRRSNAVSDRNPKVSIGLSVFNGARYLVETIDCLLAQTYEDFELVISDNASTDGTEDICRGYAARDPRVRYERQERNHGAPWNFNRVFELSKGSYFKWAAHDDLCAATFLARCVEVLDANPAVVWCQARVGVIDGRGHAVESHGPCDLSGAAEVLAATGERCRLQLAASPATRYAHQRFRRVLLGNTSCFDIYGLIRRADLQCTSLWKPCLGWEKVLLGELALRGRCAEIPEELFQFRIHEDACSALGTAEEQNAWCDPTATMRNSLVRLHLLMGHIRAMLHTPIGFCNRALCLFWIGVYLFQFRKWPTVLMHILRNQGIGGSTRETLKSLNTQERRTGDVPEMAGHFGAGLSDSTKLQ